MPLGLFDSVGAWFNYGSQQFLRSRFIHKPEAQAKGIERHAFLNALRLRFRLVSPVPAHSDGKSGAPIQRRTIHLAACRSVHAETRCDSVTNSSFLILALDKKGRLRWLYVGLPTSCPSWTMRRPISGCLFRFRPIRKKVAETQCSANFVNNSGVYFGLGPSSKVRAIFFSLVLTEQSTRCVRRGIHLSGPIA